MEMELADVVGDALGAAVVASRSVSGGDVSTAFRVELDDGRVVFAKTHHSTPVGFFQTEASGLSWLHAAVPESVPEVLAVGAEFLALTWIEPGRPASTTESDFGRTLAALHRAGASCFGRDDRRPTGSRQLPNEPVSSWAEAYAMNRLLPLAALGRNTGTLADRTVRRLESVAGRLSTLGVPIEPPARLHGDLWAGNRIVGAEGHNWLIDPAAHGGHREFDLAMMKLFGGFGADCFATYDETFPLAAGWERRVPLHQLAPLAVHAIKFGGTYEAATIRALDAAERL